MRRIALGAGIAVIALWTPAEAQQHDRGYETSRMRDGARITGTGRNFGQGYEVDRAKRRVTGTGRNFGSGYEVSGRRITGTGRNFGSGWERSPNGRDWIGTGGNFGKRCPASRGSPITGC